MGVCKTRNRPATPLGHPGILRNTPVMGREPPLLPLITKMMQKSYKPDSKLSALFLTIQLEHVYVDALS